jgi:hypothetical protein
MNRPLGQFFLATVLFPATVATALAWGAIAVDDEPGQEPDDVGYGIVTGSATKRQAGAVAMSACREAQNEDCKLVLTFRKCGAYAASRATFAVGTATSVKAAEQRALAGCAAPDCRIVASDCEP